MTLFHNLVISTCLLVCVAVGLNPPEANPQPNPPSWPPSVRVFNPDDPIEQIQSAVDAAFEINGGDGDKGQFSTARFAFLFTPGTYPVDVPVGYYTHIMGLGLSPDDTVISGPKGVHCEEGTKRFDVGALNTFWRAAENFRSTSRFNWFGGETGMLWAVSQASPLRRVNVDGDLLLFQAAEQDNEITIDNSTALVYEDENGVLVAGYSSGGFLADSAVEGRVKSGSQQQWLSRNSQIQGGWEGSNWNIVFVGTTGAPPSHCGKDGGQPYVTVDETPLIAEKPFLSVDERGQYSLLVPPVVKGTKGVSFDLSGKGNRRKTQGKTKKEQPVQIDFSQVYVANNATDSAESINDHLRLGFHVVITPGVYSLEAPLTVVHENQVVLGIGLPSLIPSAGVSSVLQISRKAEGARVAGLLVEAGRGGDREDVLVDIGVDFEGVDEGRGRTKSENMRGSRQSGKHVWKKGDRSSATPVVLSDVFVRVGNAGIGEGEDEVSADTMMRIEKNMAAGVILDNTWLWRGDHGEGGVAVATGRNPVRVGLDVGGDNVSAYGLFVEHALQDQVVWSGEGGQTFLLQSELAYDVDQEGYGDRGYTGYRVTPDVQIHQAWGVGVYHYMKSPVEIDSGIVCPVSLEENFVSPLSVYLNGFGRMKKVLNERGRATSKTEGETQYLCPVSPSSSPSSSFSSTGDLVVSEL